MPHQTPAGRHDSAAYAYLHQVLKRRSDKAFATERAALSRGLNDATAHYAIPYIQQVASPRWNAHQTRGFTYAVALAATHIGAPNALPQVRNDRTINPRLGRTLAELTHRTTGSWPTADPKKRDGVARKVALLADSDLDATVEILSSVLALAASAKYRSPIAYIDLAAILTNWGDGFTDASVQTRRRIITDYYTRPAPASATAA